MKPHQPPIESAETSAPADGGDGFTEEHQPLDGLTHGVAAQEQQQRIGVIRRTAGYLATRLSHGRPGLQEMQPLGEEDQAIVDSFETQHFVAEAPRFSELVGVTDYTHTFSSYVSTESTRTREHDGTMSIETPVRTLTEHEAIDETYDFLVTAAAMDSVETDVEPEIAKASARARKILQELHFVPDEKLEEATRGLAALWKSKLLADPNHKLCVPNVIGETETMQKSGGYIFDRIMSQFSDEERALLGPRISTSLTQLKGKPENTTVVLLDDWSISGTQLASGYGNIISDRRYTKWSNRVEVHTVAASTEQLQNSRVQGRRVPTFAYFVCRQNRTFDTDEPIVTGTHSSVDIGFEKDIEDIVAAMNQRPDQPQVTMPPLTNIVRPYRTTIR